VSRSLRVLRLLAACLLLSLTPLASADNWPQWRGADKDGCSREKGLPTTWDATTNIAWTLKLPGPGGSTPIVWGDRLFLTSADGSDLVLMCVKTDGKPVWKKVIGPAERSSVRKDEGNDASPSPSTDGKHVFVYVGSGDFACFDFDGNEVWKFNAQKRYGKFSIQHGMHVTPLLHEDRLYLSLLTNGGHWVIALDKATGKDVWKVERPSDARGESREAYASPVLWQNGKELNLVVLGCDYATGHRLSDGKEVWRLTDLNPKDRYSTAHRIITSPVASGDLLVVPSCRGLIIAALKPGASGLIKPGDASERWRNARGSPDVPSPLVHDGLVYLVRENAVLLCLEADTGKEVYSQRLSSERYRASPVYADGKLYLSGRDSGTFTVVKAGRKFEQLATNSLPDEFAASPAISEGRIYLRGFHTLYAVQEAGK
jgi:outer membrane protein assembly factor BamB